MKKSVKRIVIVLILLLVVAMAGYYYVMHGGARDVQSEATAFKVNASAIQKEFTDNTDAATKKYLNKAIEISGNITTVEDSVAVVNQTIFCKLIVPDKSLSKGAKVTVKGRVVGFDDLMGELKMDECSISK